MSMASLVFLLGYYWPFLIGALLIGVATGWLTYRAPKASGK